MELIYKKLHPDAELHSYAHTTDAGLDLTCIQEVVLHPHVPTKISTGIAIALPSNHVGLIWDKSSVGSLGIKVCGGVIDAGYQGEVIVVLVNCTDSLITFPKGKKIAQLIVQEYVSVNPVCVNEFTASTSRGESGFGSTGA